MSDLARTTRAASLLAAGLLGAAAVAAPEAGTGGASPPLDEPSSARTMNASHQPSARSETSVTAFNDAQRAYARAAVTACLELAASPTRSQDETARLVAARRVAVTDLAAMPVKLHAEAADAARIHADAAARNLDAGAPEWTGLRDAAADIVLSAWNHVRKSRELAESPGHVPLLNLPAPGGLPSGVDPAAVADPTQRAAYQQAIADNAVLAELKRDVAGLKKLDEQYSVAAGKFLRWAYSRGAGADGGSSALSKRLTEAAFLDAREIATIVSSTEK